MLKIKEIIKEKKKKLEEVPVIGELFKPSRKVSLIRMSGVIGDVGLNKKGISYQKFEKVIEKAFEKGGVEAVAFIINSPGGSPAQSMLIGNQIRKLAKEKEIPVYAFVEDVAASGGYWLACAADEIYALPVSIVGSIGVISTGFGLEDFIKKYDIKRRIYTAGNQKSFLDMFSEEKEEDVKRLKNTLEELHKEFKDWVKSRRGDKLKGTDKSLFEGQFWVASEVIDKGLVDGLGGYKEIIEEKLGKDIDIVDITPKKSFFNFAGGEVKYSGVSLSAENLIEAAFEKIEEKSIYSRYGF